MKKFLSVLLALAVAFTFTFGSTMSAFATADTTTVTTAIADADDYDYTAITKIIADQGDALAANVDTDVATAIKGEVSGGKIDGKNKESINISYEAYKTVYTDLAKIAKESDIPALEQAAMVKLNAAFAGQPSTYTIKGANVKSNIIDGMTYSIATKLAGDAIATGTTTTTNMKLAIAQLSVEIAKAQAEIDKVNLDNYSTDVNAANNYESNYTKADNAKKAAVKTLEDNAYDEVADTNEGKIEDKITAVKGAVTTLTATMATIKTKVEEGYETTDLSAIKADAIAQYTASVNGLKATAIAAQNAVITANNRVLADSTKTAAQKATAQAAIDAANEAIATINEQYPALIEVMTAVINDAKTATTLCDTYNATTGAYTLKTKYTTASDAVLDLEVAAAKSEMAKTLKSQADLAKASLSIEGNNAYNAASIDEELANTTSAMYAAVVSTTTDLPAYYSVNNCTDTPAHTSAIAALAAHFAIDAATDAEVLAAFIAECKNGGQDSKVLINDKYYASVASWTSVTYDPEIADKITELKKATNEALDAAASISEATTIFMDAYNQWDAIPTNAEHAALYAKGGALYEAATNYDAQIKAALAAKWVLVKKADYNADKTRKLEANLIAEMHKANTSEELTAKFNEMKNLIDTLKTDKELKAEIDALNARVMAIPTPIAAASKDEVLAIKKAYADLADYMTLIDANDTYAKYDTLNTQYETALKAIETKAMDDAIKAIGTVDLADKDAIKALRAAYDKYIEDYEIEGETTYKNKVEALELALSKVMVADVKAQLAKLPTDGSDPAAVKAARAAYDELTAAEKAQVGAAYYDKLIAAEKAVEALDKYTDTNAKADLLDMSRKLTIWRSSKTSIKVTAVGSVKTIKANGYTVKYSFYKKAPGATSYKLVKTTTSNKYTYTNLKKGTNKFQVKVKVYDADGKLVATKMTYYRAAKIK